MRWDWTDDWQKGSDYLVEVYDVYDVLDPDSPVSITTATVTMSAFDDIEGTTLQSGVSLPHQGSGRYTGTLVDTTAVERGMRVRVEVTVDDGANKRLAMRGLLVVR